MRQHFVIPYAHDPDDSTIGDAAGWLRERGWSLTGLSVDHDRLHHVWARFQLTIDGRYAGVPAQIRADSGAILVYDTETRTLGVSVKPAADPEDAIPERWRGPQDAVPAGFVDRNADVSLIRDRSFDGTWWLPWPLGPKRGER